MGCAGTSMILKQFYLSCLAHASYLVGDAGSSVAAVIDPQRDVDQYVAFAATHGLRIAHVILTHFHADFIAGHIELRDRTGATIHLGAAARAEYAFHPLADGDVIELGRLKLTALETPGHTPESISIVLTDPDGGSAAPSAVFTGDTLFVGDVGRPDLRVALGWSATDLGGLLYESLRSKLLSLPDTSLVYPAHGAGSLCGRAIGPETVSTIGDERRANYALQPMTKATFVDLVTADQPDAPAYFTYDAVLNTKERPTLDEALSRQLTPLSLEDVLARRAAGDEIVDTRDASEFASAHLSGSVNIGLSGEYATWAGTVLGDRPVVIIADPGREYESAMRLGRIGFDRSAGYLSGGLVMLTSRPDLVATTERVSATFAAERLLEPSPPLLLDVRSIQERRRQRIAGSVHVPLSQLVEEMSSLPRDRAILVYCEGGYRSSIAASLLTRSGFSAVSEMAGGLVAWETAGLPVETSSSGV
jgi:glyoxylase-like metal-dependent hydrolase (beta-lactamase superfamily II)/rhodanese-related sulfurtransferase